MPRAPDIGHMLLVLEKTKVKSAGERACSHEQAGASVPPSTLALHAR